MEIIYSSKNIIKRILYEKGGPSGAGIGFSKDFGVGVFPIVSHFLIPNRFRFFLFGFLFRVRVVVSFFAPSVWLLLPLWLSTAKGNTFPLTPF
jgi:hypothetical protein